MQPPRPSTLIAELSYQCPLHCPYCSNPLEIGHEKYRRELDTEDWARAFREARALGVLQLALTGGEPMLRRDLDELCRAARDAGLYSSLITAGVHFTRERGEALKSAGLDHVQISIQSPNAADNDRIAGNRSFEKKIAAAGFVKELDFPLTINCVLHRQNLDRIDELLDLAFDLGAQRLELANTQYYGWAVPNQDALMPSWEQLRRAEEAVRRFRERVGPKVDVLWVLPDFYEDLPKPCMGGWGRTAMVVAPNGDVLPCQAASTIPGLEFANVREHPLEWIWSESDAFKRFRGTDWMQEPCRSCPLGRQEVDFGGCRCQALRLTGDAAATDPVCRFSPHHGRVLAARESAQTNEFLYRAIKRPARV
jgi:pyrroloquinoline quinone biosynthesis protein E